MNIASSPAVDQLRTAIRGADMKLAMVEGFLMVPPAPNTMEQTIGLLQQATIPLRYAVGDPSLPYGMAGPANDGFRMLMGAQQTLESALYGGADMDYAQSSARADVRTGRELLKYAASHPG